MKDHGLPKKRGYFLSHTCGREQTQRPLGTSVVENPAKVLGYTQPMNVFHCLLHNFKKNLGMVSPQHPQRNV